MWRASAANVHNFRATHQKTRPRNLHAADTKKELP
jgi:hypothetical protein